jgi:hypothetical protein
MAPVHLVDSSSCLELKSVTSSANNGSLDLGATKSSVRVRNLGQSTSGSSVLLTTKVIVLGNGVALVVRVERGKRLLSLDKDVGLNESLSTVTGVNGGGQDFLEIVVENVAGTEANGRETGRDVREVVIGVGDVEVTLVFGAVVVRVANERAYQNLVLADVSTEGQQKDLHL